MGRGTPSSAAIASSLAQPVPPAAPIGFAQSRRDLNADGFADTGNIAQFTAQFGRRVGPLAWRLAMKDGT